MIQINLVSRIADDKNSFLDLVFVAYKLKESGIIDFHILFIGSIYNTSIYQNIVRMAQLLNVTQHVGFTERSIPMAELSAEVKNGYFLINSIGDFIGYSGIESLNMGFKTIFCNVDQSFTTTKYINSCQDLNAFIELVKLIAKEKEVIDRQIAYNNILMKSDFYLNEQDKDKLLSILLPAT